MDLPFPNIFDVSPSHMDTWDKSNRFAKCSVRRVTCHLFTFPFGVSSAVTTKCEPILSANAQIRWQCTSSLESSNNNIITNGSLPKWLWALSARGLFDFILYHLITRLLGYSNSVCYTPLELRQSPWPWQEVQPHQINSSGTIKWNLSLFHFLLWKSILTLWKTFLFKRLLPATLQHSEGWLTDSMIRWAEK